MEEVVQLTLNDLLVERPFTDPDHVVADTAIMRTMAKQAWTFAAQTHAPFMLDDSKTNYYPCPKTWQKRTMLFDISAMHQHESLTCVGFFGNKRANVSPELEKEIYGAGKKLCDALHDVPSMVCYVTNLLSDAYNYANFVVMNSVQTIDEWRKNEIHQSVTSILSPDYYDNVRIYNGALSVNESTYSLELQSVKYFDYVQFEPWRAVRCLKSLCAPSAV